MRGGRRGPSVVQPLHRNLMTTPTRCDAMVAEPSRDWSVFKQIFADHWEEFQCAHPRSHTSYYDGLVAKMQHPQSTRRNNFPGEQIPEWYLLLSKNLSASNYPGAAKMLDCG